MRLDTATRTGAGCRARRARRAASVAVAAALASALPAYAGAPFTVLRAVETPGEWPTGLLVGSDGNLYGTLGDDAPGGRVFALTPDPDGSDWAFASLVEFPFDRAWTQGDDGFPPVGGLIEASDGKLYGTTPWGGNPTGEGTIFTLTRDPSSGSYTQRSVAYRLRPGDGAGPSGGVMQASDGNLYGLSTGGVFELERDGTGAFTRFSLLVPMTGYVARTPRLVEAADGNLYGTWGAGPWGSAGPWGDVFRLTRDGDGRFTVFTELHAFTGGADGAIPWGGLLAASDGRLYGTTSSGGSSGQGTLFAIEPDAQGSLSAFRVLHAFAGGTDEGAFPVTRLVETSGKLYGTTLNGGLADAGTLYEVARPQSDAPYSEVSVKHTFLPPASGADFVYPACDLVVWPDGRLIGATGFTRYYIEYPLAGLMWTLASHGSIFAFAPQPGVPTLGYSGPDLATIGGRLRLAAVLEGPRGPVAGEPVAFIACETVGGVPASACQTCSAASDVRGAAACEVEVPAGVDTPPAEIRADYAGSVELQLGEAHALATVYLVASPPSYAKKSGCGLPAESPAVVLLFLADLAWRLWRAARRERRR